MNNLDAYNKLKKKSFFSLREKVKTHIPTPTEIDYKRGWIKRFFVQKTNDKASSIYEVDSAQFSILTSRPIFTLVTIRWRLTGPTNTQYDSIGNIMDKGVKESNRIAISLVEDRIPNLKLYLPNLLQFHQ